MAGDFGNFSHHDFANPYPAPSMSAYSEAPTPAYPPLQPNHGAVYGGAAVPQHPAYHAAPPSRSAEKRKSEDPLSGHSENLEDSSRHAADEDKRRRNTAASARFRIKKKQREQALEKSAKEMTDKVTALENKVSQLETENKWLKNLLVDKNEGNEDIIALWKDFAQKAASKAAASKEPVKAER
jgi:hypothetical protein